MSKALGLLLLFSGLAAAQPFGAGLKVGTTLTDAINSIPSFSVPNDRHFIAGPYVEVRLPFHLAVEADALYESSLFSSVLSGGSTWQFPVLAKYRLLGGPIRPYIEGGPSFSRITDIAEIPALNHRSNYGIVLGAGIELKLLFLRVAPEVRYNGWALKNIESPTGQFESNRNQALFLVGIGF
jgi:hypothetical protein